MPRWLSVGIAGYYLYVYVTGPGPLLTGDSRGWLGDDAGVRTHRDLDVVWGSITGRYVRPWPVVVPYELIDNQRVDVAVQLVVACAATIYLSRAMFLVATGGRAQVGGGLVALVLMAPAVAGWHSYIIGESLTISATAFLFGAAIRLCRQLTGGSAAVFLIASLAAASLRPQLSVVVLTAAAVVCARWWGSRSAVGLAVATVLVVVLVGAWWRANINTWHEGPPRPAIAAAYAFSDFSPIARELRAASREERPAPACFPVDRGFPADQAVIWKRLDESFRQNRCELAVEWSDGFSRWYAGYLLGHPGDSVRFMVTVLPDALSDADAPNAGWSLIPSFGRVTTYLAVLLLVAETFAAVARRVRLDRRASTLVILGLAIAWLAIPLAAAGAFGNPTEPFDTARIAVSASLILRVGVIIAAVVLAEAGLRGRRRTEGDDILMADARKPPPSTC